MSNLLRHKKAHTGIKPFECRRCGKKCSSLSNLAQHASIHQQKRRRYKFSCFVGDCTTSYLYTCTLKKHLKKCHPQELQLLQEEYKNTNFMQLYRILTKYGKEKAQNNEKFAFLKIKTDYDDWEAMGPISDRPYLDDENFLQNSFSFQTPLVQQQAETFHLGRGPKNRTKIRTLRRLKRKLGEKNTSQEKQTVILSNVVNADTFANSDPKNVFLDSLEKMISLTPANSTSAFQTDLLIFFLQYLNKQYLLNNDHHKIINLINLRNELLTTKGMGRDNKDILQKLTQLLADEVINSRTQPSSPVVSPVLNGPFSNPAFVPGNFLNPVLNPVVNPIFTQGGILGNNSNSNLMQTVMYLLKN